MVPFGVDGHIIIALVSAGSDFVAFSYMLEIPAGAESITFRNVSILDDNINEAEEVFILVVKLVGFAENRACFQRQKGGECMGNTGGLIIQIRDNDRKLINPQFMLVTKNIMNPSSITSGGEVHGVDTIRMYGGTCR